MINTVLEYAARQHMFEKNDYVVAGVSGGADSVCLLFMLIELRKRLPIELHVVHVNHLIRPEANDDAAYVEQICREQGIPFTLVECDVQKIAAQQHISTEEAGRNARYEAFYRMLGSRQGKIAVAHNKNDCCETFLFNLFRGSSLKGLSGIKPVRERIVRPLMCLERAQIEEFLMRRQIRFCIDATNLEDNYTRNKIRHHILKTAEEEISPAAVSHISEACGKISEAYDLIEELTAQAYCDCVTSKREQDGIAYHLDAGHFNSLHKTLKGYVIIEIVARAAGSRKDITSAHIEQIEALFKKQCGRRISLPYGLEAVRDYKGVKIGKADICEDDLDEYPEIQLTGEHLSQLESGEALSFEWGEQGKLEISLIHGGDLQNIIQKKYTKWFDYDKIKNNIVIRTRKKGDFLTINSSNQRKTLKSYFVDQKVPQAERDRTCLLTDNSHVIWVVGGRISNFYKIGEDTRNILQAEFTHYNI